MKAFGRGNSDQFIKLVTQNTKPPFPSPPLLSSSPPLPFHLSWPLCPVHLASLSDTRQRSRCPSPGKGDMEVNYTGQVIPLKRLLLKLLRELGV